MTTGGYANKGKTQANVAKSRILRPGQLSKKRDRMSRQIGKLGLATHAPKPAAHVPKPATTPTPTSTTTIPKPGTLVPKPVATTPTPTTAKPATHVTKPATIAPKPPAHAPKLATIIPQTTANVPKPVANALKQPIPTSPTLSPPPSHLTTPSNSIPLPIQTSTPEVFTFIPTPGRGLPPLGGSSYCTTNLAHVEGAVDSGNEEEGGEEEEEDRDHQVEHNEGEVHPPPYVPERDVNGKIIIHVIGRGLAPGKEVVDAIRFAIQTQFRGPYHSWTETPVEVRNRWWELFQKKVSFEPHLEHKIQHLFNQKCKKRLSDMLTKVRMKGIRPMWMGEEAYAGLIKHWESETFKQLSTQNKTNRASTKGGAVHTSGRKAHLDVALEIGRNLGRDANPDELFIKTHKRKKGEWVDNRAQATYEHYQQSLRQRIVEIGETSADGLLEVDGATKLQLWQESAGGRSRGRVYGTGDLSANLKRGATSLTQVPNASSTSWSLESERAARLKAEEVAARAEERAVGAEETAKQAQERVQTLEKEMHTLMTQFQERVQALERQSVEGSCNTHPHYDNDLDDQSLNGDD